jgi:hypothetical protein
VFIKFGGNVLVRLGLGACLCVESVVGAVAV